MTEIFVSGAAESASFANPTDAFVPFSYSANTLKSTTEQSAPDYVNALAISDT
jgi:hypothetical protein